MNADIQNLLTQAANQYGVDPALAIAVAQQESGGDPNAVSSVGAQGVMQLMPATAKQLGVTNPFDPVQNIDAGVRFLASMLSQFGDPQLALAAYNWGPGNVSKHGFSNWPAETVHYVATILKNAGLDVSAVASADPTDPTDPSSSSGGGADLVGILVVAGLAAWLVSRLWS